MSAILIDFADVWSFLTTSAMFLKVSMTSFVPF